MTNPDFAVAAAAAHYQRPGWVTRNVFNRLIARLTRMGLSLWGSRVLRVRGRTSGQLRSNPVNVLTLDGERYLVSPRGQTNWVRNLRVAGTGELVVGQRVEPFTATEIGAAGQPTGPTPDVAETSDPRSDNTAGSVLTVTVLRAYLRRWQWEVGQFFDGVGPDSTDAELLTAAPKHPMFRIAAVHR